jgi:hypothetical protein
MEMNKKPTYAVYGDFYLSDGVYSTEDLFTGTKEQCQQWLEENEIDCPEYADLWVDVLTVYDGELDEWVPA